MNHGLCNPFMDMYGKIGDGLPFTSIHIAIFRVSRSQVAGTIAVHLPPGTMMFQFLLEVPLLEAGGSPANHIFVVKEGSTIVMAECDIYNIIYIYILAVCLSITELYIYIYIHLFSHIFYKCTDKIKRCRIYSLCFVVFFMRTMLETTCRHRLLWLGNWIWSNGELTQLWQDRGIQWDGMGHNKQYGTGLSKN